MRYIEFIISLSNLKGSLYMTEKSLEKYELRIFLLAFQFDYWLVFYLTLIINFLDTLNVSVNDISVRYEEFVTSLTLLKYTANISPHNFVKCEMKLLLLEFSTGNSNGEHFKYDTFKGLCRSLLKWQKWDIRNWSIYWLLLKIVTKWIYKVK